MGRGARFSSHLPFLIRAVTLTSGDVLECGVGAYSTPVLHWLCRAMNRRLVSMEGNRKYFDQAFHEFHEGLHEVRFIANWDDADVEQPWDVVFIDHENERRRVEAARVAPFAKLVVIHDTQPKGEKVYQLSSIQPLFKASATMALTGAPSTTVFSNVIADLERLFAGRSA